MKVWQSLEEVTAWRLLEEAKDLIAVEQAPPDKIKQAEEALDGANGARSNIEQQARLSTVTSQISLEERLTTSAPSVDSFEAQVTRPMALVPAGEFTMGSTLRRRREARTSRVPRRLLHGQVLRDSRTVCQVFGEQLDMKAPPEWDIMNQATTSETPRRQYKLVRCLSHTVMGRQASTDRGGVGKGGTGDGWSPHPWGNEPPTRLHANFGKKSWEDHMALVPVGMFEMGKSPYGIDDMAGNAWEWVNDWYDHDYYKKSPAKNPQGPATGKSKVVRGGNWLYVPEFPRSSFRFNAEPSRGKFGYGFRCAKTP